MSDQPCCLPLTGAEIYARSLCEACPDRAIETLSSVELGVLIQELQLERWENNWAAMFALQVATEAAVCRFLADVEIDRMKGLYE